MTLNSPVGNRAADGPATSSAAPASLTLALTPARPFAVCPVDRPRSYVDDFGDPRWFGGFHRHQGIDILAPWGTPVRAPFDGTASRSTSWAGGLTVKIKEQRLGPARATSATSILHISRGI